MKKTTHCTLLNVIEAVQDQTRSDDEVVAVIAHMIDSGRLVLTGDLFNSDLAEPLAA